MKTLINVTELRERMQAGTRTVLLDVRWTLGGPHGHDPYLRGHIPGAVFVDLETELSGHGKAQQGRHPLPDPAALTQAARGWGINSGDTVVAYDDGGNMAAARLWWLLRDGGFDRVALLDGGLGAWRAAGYPIADGDQRPPAGDVQLASGRMPTIGIGTIKNGATGTEALGNDSVSSASAGLDDVRRWPSSGVLLDARAGERYRGETEPMDPRAGHIPGAVNAPTSANLTADKRFLPPAELAARFAALGVTPSSAVAVYCGSGVTAAHEIAALEIAGIRATLFPGSWSAWSNHPELPVATGPQPAQRQQTGNSQNPAIK
ncbi:sulfurtransferase [Paeniglutamicibacter antarcticus]|uniref:Sulfurtransferase n=1 Tax=Arthrobacter terrae TaxID=2935737 RepID=A0A931CN24_9MICC|nr:sulfurtransferase [Arthrobacter terrae]MBG0741258.1 sulfurtransferase [Arthrobacter terrae]